MTTKTLDYIAGRRFTIIMAHIGVIRIYRKAPATATMGTPAALGQRG